MILICPTKLWYQGDLVNFGIYSNYGLLSTKKTNKQTKKPKTHKQKLLALKSISRNLCNIYLLKLRLK